MSADARADPASRKETPIRHARCAACFAVLGTSLIGACSLSNSVASAAPCTRIGTYAVGDTLRDSVVASSCRLDDGTYMNEYRFQLAAQTKLRFSLSSPRNHAFMVVADTTGVVIANSSFGSAPDTTATLRAILKPGNYLLDVSSAAAAPSGPLQVIASPDSSAVRGCLPIWVSTTMATTQTLAAADCTTGPLGAGYFFHLYLKAIHTGEELKLTEHSGAFTPQVWIVDQAGTTQGNSSLDSTGTNARIDYIPGSSVLLLWVGSSSQSAFGQYTLTIN